VRDQLKELTKQYDKSENDLKALQSVGQVGYKTSVPYLPNVKSVTDRVHLLTTHVL